MKEFSDVSNDYHGFTEEKNMHDHCECEHELKYCKKCDVVYCQKCGREWGKWKPWDPNYTTTVYRYTITYPNGLPEDTWVSSPTGTGTTSWLTHQCNGI